MSSYISETIPTANILWGEWKDTDLNNEKWNAPKNGPDGLFLDTQLVPMPPSLAPYQWIRAKNLNNLTDTLAVYEVSTSYPDLIVNNKHIIHSEFMRWYISTLITLQYCGQNGLEVEDESPNFCWNERYHPWQGWMHVYSMNKVGADVPHRPIINPHGKYVVRLYFMGCWRRVVVDDMIPVDKVGIPLLPCTANNFELWPMLLAKALLKLASLTWSRHREIVDFHPVCYFTGWVCLSLDVRHLPSKDKWDLLVKYAEHFEWTAKEPSETEIQVMHTTPAKGKAKVAKPKKSKDVTPRVRIPVKSDPVALFFDLQDTRNTTADTIPGFSPCWSHMIYVLLSRDIPLDEKDMKTSLVPWKMYRWVYWAIEKNLINGEEYFVPIRSLKVVSPLKEYDETVTHVYNDTDDEKDEVLANNKNDKNKNDKNNKNENKNNEESPRSEKKKTTENENEDTVVDISVWGDFNKMASYIEKINLFYKLNHFEYRAKLSDAIVEPFQLDKKPAEVNKSSKAESKKSSPRSEPNRSENDLNHSYAWPQKMLRCKNEPFYFLSDSTEHQFFLINFSTMQLSHESLSSAEGEDNGIVQARKSYLIMERYSWFSRIKDEPIVCLTTAGTKSIVFELEPGRHLLRLFCKSESGCFLTISSDTNFCLGNRETIHKIMCKESERIDVVVKNISESIVNALQSFGTEQYTTSLKDYFKSYMPDKSYIPRRKDEHDKDTIILMKAIHTYFMKELVKSIIKMFDSEDVNDVVYALRVFFLDPNIRLEKLESDISGVPDTLLEDDLNENLDIENIENEESTTSSSNNFEISESNEDIQPNYDKAATKIQSLMRMIVMKRYRNIHNPKDKDHQMVEENLYKVSELFNHAKRESPIHQVLRRFLKRHATLSEMYPYASDFQHVLQVQESHGILLNVKPDQWIPTVRFTINTLENESVFAAMNLFISLPDYILRVFNNDTKKEVFRVVNNVIPNLYRYTEKGYTIFGYGRSEDIKTKELEWTLHIVTMKGEPLFYPVGEETSPLSSDTEIPNLVIEELTNTYIPNVNDCICKLIIHTAGSSLVSLRLKTSYDGVSVRLRIVDEEDNVTSETEGGSTLVLPFAFLESEDDKPIEKEIVREKEKRKSDDRSMKLNNIQEYTVEAFVLNESWPLTESEWFVVAERRQKEAEQLVRRRVSSFLNGKSSKLEIQRLKRSSKYSLEGAQMDPPYWTLQVVSDSGSSVRIFQDKTKQKELTAMKEAWAFNDPGRAERGRRLREAFIERHAILPITSTAGMSMTPGGYSVVNDEVRSLKPPPSYRRYVPPLDLTPYIRKDEEVEERWVKTESDEEMLRNQRQINVIDSDRSYMEFLEELDELLNVQLTRYQKLSKEHSDRLSERRDRMEKTYETRKTYIENLQKAAAETPEKKKTEKKKPKK